MWRCDPPTRIVLAALARARLRRAAPAHAGAGRAAAGPAAGRAAGRSGGRGAVGRPAGGHARPPRPRARAADRRRGGHRATGRRPRHGARSGGWGGRAALRPGHRSGRGRRLPGRPARCGRSTRSWPATTRRRGSTCGCRRPTQSRSAGGAGSGAPSTACTTGPCTCSAPTSRRRPLGPWWRASRWVTATPCPTSSRPSFGRPA